MLNRHLAGTEAVDLDLVLEVDELARQALFEILGGKHHLELALQTLRECFRDLHDYVPSKCEAGAGAGDDVRP